MKYFTENQLMEVVSNIWSTMLSLETKASYNKRNLMRTPLYSAYITLSGGFDGGVILQTSQRHASLVAAIIFNKELAEIQHDELRDIMGELTNIIGGHVKAMFNETCNLSLPFVVENIEANIQIPNTRILMNVMLESNNEPISITFFESLLEKV